jgi:hypothetical protein
MGILCCLRSGRGEFILLDCFKRLRRLGEDAK